MIHTYIRYMAGGSVGCQEIAWSWQRIISSLANSTAEVNVSNFLVLTTHSKTTSLTTTIQLIACAICVAAYYLTICS